MNKVFKWSGFLALCLLPVFLVFVSFSGEPVKAQGGTIADAVDAADEAIENLPSYITLEAVESVFEARNLIRDAVRMGAPDSAFENLAALQSAMSDARELINTLYEQESTRDVQITAWQDGTMGANFKARFEDAGSWYAEGESHHAINDETFGDLEVFSRGLRDVSVDPQWIEFDISDKGYDYLEGWFGIVDASTAYSFPPSFRIYGEIDGTLELLFEIEETWHGLPAYHYFLDVSDVDKVRFELEAEVVSGNQWTNRIGLVEPVFHTQKKEWASISELGDPGSDNRHLMGFFVQFDNVERWDPSVTINDREFAPLLVYRVMHSNLTEPRWIKYDISKWGYEVMKGYAGIADESSITDFPVDIEIFGDGVLLFEATLEYKADAIPYELDIAGMDELIIQVSAEATTDANWANRLGLVEPHFLRATPAAALENAIAAIDDLPAELTITERPLVVEARRLVEAALTLGAVEGDIGNLSRLEDAEAVVDALVGEIQDTIDAAIDAIADLPVEITLDDRDQVEAARHLVDDAFAAGAVKGDITNLSELLSAEQTIIKLEEQQDYLAALAAVEEAEAEKDRASVDAARPLVDALSEGSEKEELQTRLDTVEAGIIAVEEGWLIEEATEILMIRPVDGSARANFTGSGLEILLTTDVESGVISVTRSSQDDRDAPEGMKDAGIYLRIERTDNLAGAPADLEVSFDSAELPGDIDEETLRLYRYNETTESWEVVFDQEIELFKKVILAGVTELGEFAVFGSLEDEDLPGAGSLLFWLVPLGLIMVGAGLYLSRRYSC